MCFLATSTAEETEREEDGEKEFVGSKTEIALLEFTRKLGFSYDKDRAATRIEKVIPFSSARKRMSTIVFPDSFTSVNNHNSFKNVFVESNNLIAGKRILFSKGASEIILGGCTKYLNESGDILPLSESDRQRFADKIEEFANDALRTLCVAFKPLDSLCDSLAPETVSTLIQAESIESVSAPSVDGGGVAASSREEDRSNLIFIGVFGIQDPLREEVAASVLQCQKAGVVVRMVTGDNIATARSIAKQCGILTEGGLIMEGPAFRRLSPERMDEIVPQLQVLARSSPQDKQILVNCLRNLGETVAVTGDGTNDAPALKSADIGFSMGIAGTEVAKEASDIVLMDDNFVSLVKAIMWGRSVYDSVRKFLQFQLTVNVVK